MLVDFIWFWLKLLKGGMHENKADKNRQFLWCQITEIGYSRVRFSGELELEVRGKRAILSPVVSPRLNWFEECQNDLIVKPALKKGEWQW